VAFQHRMQRNRFEYKYLIDERCAHDVRSFARTHLVRDEFARADMKWSYPTHSVYFDGPAKKALKSVDISVSGDSIALA